MIPRADIVALRADLTLDETLQKLREEQHSRLPIYRDQLDDILGMVHIKDVFAYIGRPEEFSLEKMLRRPLMVAPQAPVLELLVQMRQARVHLALVIDEYGGVDGLITIEDLVETIVGDIADEHDDEPITLKHEGGSFVADARMELKDFAKDAGFELPVPEDSEGIDSLGGLVVSHLGRVPQRGEIVEGPAGFVFEVLEADPRRVRRLRIRPPKTDIVT
jgi:magnesium and cobalt transporter